jgi:hypothetical protein
MSIADTSRSFRESLAREDYFCREPSCRQPMCRKYVNKIGRLVIPRQKMQNKCFRGMEMSGTPNAVER